MRRPKARPLTGGVVRRGQSPFEEVASGQLSVMGSLAAAKLEYTYRREEKGSSQAREQDRFNFYLSVALGDHPFHADYILSQAGPGHIPHDATVYLLEVFVHIYLVLWWVGPDKAIIQRTRPKHSKPLVAALPLGGR
ncbi:uncharacterized protein PG986_008598 [Apiospora aurea]|uniref:Uncharacterized protein n=1 Tax=Apiospora aurea TaxID=335848 RepID=A0ABR1Q609_9PEZI